MPRARVVLLERRRVALIERRRPGRRSGPEQRYFVFPGGGVEAGETPEAAAVREAHEELGLVVRVERPVATVVSAGEPHHYFLVEKVGGTFGSGHGDEVGGRLAAYRGSYAPVWVDVGELERRRVFAREVAELLPRALERGWPDQAPVFVNDGSDFPVYPPDVAS